MVHSPLLVALALGCVVAAVVWGRSCLRLERAWRRILAAAEAASAADKAEIAESEQAAAELARSAYRKELHTTILYIVLAACAAASSLREPAAWQVPFLAVVVPIAITLRYGPRFL